MKSRIVAAVLVPAAFACQQDVDAGGGLATEVRDSAGIQITLERNRDDPNAAYVSPMAVRSDGSILAGHHPHLTDPVLVDIRDAEGRVRSLLGEHSGDERYIAHEGTDRSIMFRPIYGALAAQVPWGDLIVHSLNNRYEIRALAEDGTLARIVRRDHVPRAPTPADIEAYIEEQVSWYPANLSESEVSEYQAEGCREYQSVPVAEHFPAFTSIVIDKLDHLAHTGNVGLQVHSPARRSWRRSLGSGTRRCCPRRPIP